jgi:hypothetical protein
MSERLFDMGQDGRGRARGPLVRALGRTVTAMDSAGTIEPVDELTIAGTRAAARLADASMADDELGPFVVARALAELGAWHDRLRPLAGVAGADALDAALELLTAPVVE